MATAAAPATLEESRDRVRPCTQPQAGDLFDGYQLIRPIGRGGTGTVWAARRLADGLQLAIKMLAPGMLERYPELATRLVREWEACSRIESERVVRVYGHGIYLGLPYLVMEHVQGETLYDRVRRCPLGLEETVGLVAQIAEALTAAHQAGVIHRDVKAGNVMLCAGGLKVLDFGFAKLEAERQRVVITQEGTSLGSPTYMSPEQFLGSSTVDHRTDVWALAVVAYFALTGAYPFSGLTFVAIATEVLEHRFTAPSHLRPELPLVLDRIFQRAFALQIDDRYPSAAALAQDLSRAVALPSLTLADTCYDGERPQHQTDHPVEAVAQRRSSFGWVLRWSAIALACLVASALLAQLV